jgi:hypothetical protein
MGFRFRKSIKLAPGVRMNFSKSGASWTIGPRGASIGFGQRGTYLNTGIPGTGIYSRQNLGGSNRRASNQRTYTKMQAEVGITDDGTVYFHDENGNPLPAHLVNAAKRQQGDVIKNLIQQKCDEINAQIESLGEIHIYTPDPSLKPTYIKQEYQEPFPQKPTIRSLGLLGRLFKSVREKIENENTDNKRLYHEAGNNWHEEKKLFDDKELIQKEIIEKAIYEDNEAMEKFLEENLQSIMWPRETLVTFEIIEGKCIFIDVDLPEIEDMPNKTASIPQRGYKLTVKEISKTKVQQLYMRHVHGIGFRIIGEAFASLPNIQEVVLSTFSQRPDQTTGHLVDEYLYSVQVDRKGWSQINFDNLGDLDLTEALAQFKLRRNVSKTGIFKPIDPFQPN